MGGEAKGGAFLAMTLHLHTSQTHH